MTGIADEYTGRLNERESAAAQLMGRHRQLGVLRLLLACAFVALLWWWHHDHGCPWWSCLFPVALFLASAAYHSRILGAHASVTRAVAFYRDGLARIRDEWVGAGQAEPRGSFQGSLFATDLDLFGTNSLFALVSQARTRAGEDQLAEWLLHPAPVEIVLHRQAAVAELRGRTTLREDAAVLSPGAAARGNHAALLSWAEGVAVLRRTWVRIAAPFLAALSLASLALWWTGGSRLPFFTLVLIDGAVVFAHRGKTAPMLHEAEHALADLDLFAALLERMERESFSAPLLCDLQGRLRSGGGSASQAVASLRRVGTYVDSRDNLFVKALNIPLLYDVQVAYAAEAWRRTHGKDVRGWLTALAELEALLSLGGYSAEHPGDPFPEFVESGDGASNSAALFEAEALGHPLLPAARCVRNDVRLGSDAAVMLISGSNMSGKSTLLRALGLNALLAMAGAPVRAARLRMTACEVGASILVNDSLAEGASRFYAEITRLRAICDRAGQAPALLFLLDELLEGTNSQDRQVGAAGILHTLAARGAIGVATTHDLALTAQDRGTPLRNMHFEDTVRDGQMVFDYRLREGVVQRSNGVALMRMVGLDV